MAMSEPPPEVAAATSDVPRLGCGRSVDEVWDGLHREPDEHERDCEHCTRAREQLQRLMGVADQAREEEASEASERPRPGLTAQIMDLARTEIRRGRLLPLERTDPGVTVSGEPTGSIGSAGSFEGGLAISDIAVMAVVRRAADTVPGVRARRCQITSNGAADETTGGGAVDTATVTLSVELQVAVALGTSIPALTERLRTVITDAVDEHVGVGVDRIDITVGDLYDA